MYGNQVLDTLLVLESELDAILMIQEAGDICFCMALGGCTQPLDFIKEGIVRGVEKLLFCPDYDDAGRKSWYRWSEKFHDTIGVVVPQGKDPGEALKHGVDLREWIKGEIE